MSDFIEDWSKAIREMDLPRRPSETDAQYQLRAALEHVSALTARLAEMQEQARLREIDFWSAEELLSEMAEGTRELLADYEAIFGDGMTEESQPPLVAEARARLAKYDARNQEGRGK